MGSFLFCCLAVEEEQNSSNAGRRATEDDEEKSLKQSTLLCCFYPTLFSAAIDADGQTLADEMMMIVYPQTLGFIFRNSRRRWQILVYSLRSFESLHRIPAYML